jgi:hypothetical protein
MQCAVGLGFFLGLDDCRQDLRFGLPVTLLRPGTKPDQMLLQP